MTQTISASPAKLRDGGWGARVRGAVTEGDTVTITTRAGKSWEARVTKVVWTGDGLSICATESLDRASAPRTRRSRGCSCTDPGCDCLTHRCMCPPHCNCRGGNIYDC